jgi:hypothetical protein
MSAIVGMAITVERMRSAVILNRPAPFFFINPRPIDNGGAIFFTYLH